MNIKLVKAGFIRGHLLFHLTLDKCYEVRGTYRKYKKIVDDNGQEVWVSGTLQKKYFKEEI